MRDLSQLFEPVVESMETPHIRQRRQSRCQNISWPSVLAMPTISSESWMRSWQPWHTAAAAAAAAAVAEEDESGGWMCVCGCGGGFATPPQSSEALLPPPLLLPWGLMEGKAAEADGGGRGDGWVRGTCGGPVQPSPGGRWGLKPPPHSMEGENPMGGAGMAPWGGGGGAARTGS